MLADSLQLDRFIRHNQPEPLAYTNTDWASMIYPESMKNSQRPSGHNSVCLSSLSFGLLISASLLCCMTAVIFTALFFVRTTVFKN